LESLFKNKENLSEITGLAKDAISNPVQLNSSWAIFKCLGDSVKIDVENSEDFEAAKTYLYANEKGVVQDYYTNKANDFIAAAATSSFSEACQKFGVERDTTPSFALNWNNQTLIGRSALEDKAALKGASVNESFLKAAFKLSKGEVSAPLVISSTDNVVVLRCLDVTEGGTSADDAARLIGPEIAEADSVVVNSVILNSPKIKSNSAEFMAVFTGEKQ
jgi:hypothetical protein